MSLLGDINLTALPSHSLEIWQLILEKYSSTKGPNNYCDTETGALPNINLNAQNEMGGQDRDELWVRVGGGQVNLGVRIVVPEQPFVNASDQNYERGWHVNCQGHKKGSWTNPTKHWITIEAKSLYVMYCSFIDRHCNHNFNYFSKNLVSGLIVTCFTWECGGVAVLPKNISSQNKKYFRSI